MIVKSAEQFEKLNAFSKGYVVYMFGARDDEPFVPKTYKPSQEEKEDYQAGGRHAVIEAQDNP